MAEGAFYLWLPIVAGLYLIADHLYRACGQRAIANPVLLPVILLIASFHVFGGDVRAFETGTRPLMWMLSAAVAALAVPLYRSRHAIRRNKPAIVAAIAGGSITGVGLAIVPALVLEGGSSLGATLATKSITTPIAMAAAESIGGLPPLAAAVVIVTGLFAALVGPPFLRLLGVDDETTLGLALGTAGHAIGTAEAVRLSDGMGAAAAFAMTTNGLATALLLPIIWPIFV